MAAGGAVHAPRRRAVNSFWTRVRVPVYSAGSGAVGGLAFFALAFTFAPVAEAPVWYFGGIVGISAMCILIFSWLRLRALAYSVLFGTASAVLASPFSIVMFATDDVFYAAFLVGGVLLVVMVPLLALIAALEVARRIVRLDSGDSPRGDCET